MSQNSNSTIKKTRDSSQTTAAPKSVSPSNAPADTTATTTTTTTTTTTSDPSVTATVGSNVPSNSKEATPSKSSDSLNGDADYVVGEDIDAIIPPTNSPEEKCLY